MAHLLVTGTDTGVGKTVVAAALVTAARAAGRRAIGFKPAETGIGGGEPADSEVVAAASGVDEPLARPLLRLAEPLAPAIAAERAGAALDPKAVVERVRALQIIGYEVVVEGAGGLLVPLAWGFTAADLAAEAGLEVVIVARAGLGTLNHTLLTVAELSRRGLRLRGIVLNGRADPPSLAEATNPEALAKLLPGVPVLVWPRVKAANALAAARELAPRAAALVAEWSSARLPE